MGCPEGFRPVGPACAANPRKVRVQPAKLVLGPGDWEAQGVVVPREVVVRQPFDIDATEVTTQQWAGCVSAGACEPPGGVGEPGQPVRWVTFAQAEAYCRWVGGEVPHEDQWLLAAAGESARRYPWGDTGAVCRRASWGLLEGPCARGGSGPDLAGLPETDSTPSGVQGLAGGVAEWVRGTDGLPATRGGSWRSRLASELRTWRRVGRPDGHRFDDVGLRCVYVKEDAAGGDVVLRSPAP